MKAIKYVFMSALLMGFSTAVMAQDGTKADVDAVVKLIQSKPADMAKAMKPFYSKNKKNVDNLVAFGRAFLGVKDLANAQVAAQNALKASNNKSSSALILLGDIELYKGEEANAGNAAANYEMAISIDPKNTEAYRKYALAYRRVNLEDAMMKLEELRRAVPDYPVDALIANLNYQSLKYSTAADYYAKVPLNQLTTVDFAQYTFSLYKNKKYDEAIKVVDAGLQKDPLNATLNRLGMYCSVEKKLGQKALSYADAMFNKIDKDSVNLTEKDYLHYGKAYGLDSIFDQAIQKYQAGLGLNTPNSADRPELFKGISDSYKGMKDFENAIKSYEDYLNALESATANDYASYGTLFMQYGRTLEGDARTSTFQKADKVFADMIEKFPGSEEYGYFQRARANANLDPDMEQALAKPYFEKVIELVSARENLDEIDKSRLENSYRYMLGYYNSIMKDKVNALEYAKKVQELAPSDNINALVESLSKSIGQ